MSNRKNQKNRLIHILMGIAFSFLFLHPLSPSVADPTPESPEQRDQRMAWWRDARFGMFIHWGLYAIPAGTWNGQAVEGTSEWLMHTAKIPVLDYEPLAQKFNPTAFNAEAWVSLAKRAGMKYLIITTKHHDGFSLFNSVMTDFDIMNTPFKRDIMKELADECHKQGLKIGWYHSIMDWHHPEYLPRRPWDPRPANEANLDRYLEYMKGQLKELLTNYGEVSVLWFDGGWEHTLEELHSEEIVAQIRSIQPNILINDRIQIPQDFNTPEQFIPATGIPGRDWESCMTMNNTWGFKADDTNWKSTQTLIRNLVNCTSKGGNYLLNVGPNAEGLIPEASVATLEAMGRWLEQNGESIYGTSPSPFKKLGWGRCTQKPGKLYLHVFSWPQGPLMIPGLQNEVKKAYFLADPNQVLEPKREGERVYLPLPAQPLNEEDTVIVLEIEGAPEIIPVPIRPDSDGALQLTAIEADLHGIHVQLETLTASVANIGYWTNPEDTISWEFETLTTGDYKIQMEYACAENSVGSEVALLIADQTLKTTIENTGSWTQTKTVNLGTIKLPKGELTLFIKPLSKPNLAVMNLFKVTITPAQ